MKHIERKFLLQLTETEFEKISEGKKFNAIVRSENTEPIDKNKINKNAPGYLQTESGMLIQGFPHNLKGKIFLIPEPDPTLIYFSSAQTNYRESEHHKQLLLPKIDIQSNITEEVVHDFYNYFGSACGCIIFLFTSLECFMNSLIKDDDIYKKIQKNRTELYSKKQIEESVSFDEKIKFVIPQLTGVDFLKKHPLPAQTIYGLKDFRDNIIHTKSNKELFTYDHVVKRALSFSYANAIDAVSKYMNGYKPKYITECGCGKDF